MRAHIFIDAHIVERGIAALPVMAIVPPQHFTLPELNRNRVGNHQSWNEIMFLLHGHCRQLFCAASDEAIGQDVGTDCCEANESRRAPSRSAIAFTAPRNPNASDQGCPQPYVDDE